MKKLYVINHVKTTSLHQHLNTNSDELTALRKITPVVGEDGEAGASFSPGVGTVGSHFDLATPFLVIHPEETVIDSR